MILYVGLPDGDKRNEKGEPVVLHTNYIYTSKDLKEWSLASKLPSFYECQELIDLQVEGEPTQKKWVLFGAPGEYLVGDFDGETFIPEPDKGKLDFGPNFYAVQCWLGGAPGDARRILIPWMRGGNYPDMPFNQQMGFPTELVLRRTGKGLRVVRRPIREIENIWRDTETLAKQPLETKNPFGDIRGEAFDLDMEIQLGKSGEFILSIRGAVFSFRNGVLSHREHSMNIPHENGRIKFRILVDVTSVELFTQDGLYNFSACFVPEKHSQDLSLTGSDAGLIVASLRKIAI